MKLYAKFSKGLMMMVKKNIEISPYMCYSNKSITSKDVYPGDVEHIIHFSLFFIYEKRKYNLAIFCHTPVEPVVAMCIKMCARHPPGVLMSVYSLTSPLTFSRQNISTNFLITIWSYFPAVGARVRWRAILPLNSPHFLHSGKQDQGGCYQCNIYNIEQGNLI